MNARAITAVGGLVMVLLVLESCTLISGAWDAVFGGEPGGDQGAAVDAGAMVIGEELRDEKGHFDPSRVLEESEKPLLAEQPQQPRGDEAEPAPEPPEVEGVGDETEKVAAARNPEPRHPGPPENTTMEVVDMTLEFCVIALLAALVAFVARSVRRHPCGSALVASFIALAVAVLGLLRP